MPNLPACNLGDYKYQLTFWTVEADPKEEPSVSKAKLGRIFSDNGNIDKCFVSREVSETGYNHHHVVCKFNKPQRMKKLLLSVQQGMQYKKSGGGKISVRVFHPRKGSDEDYTKLMSYITEKKFKDADPDPEGALEVKPPPCMFCGLHTCVLQPTTAYRHLTGKEETVWQCEKHKWKYMPFF